MVGNRESGKAERWDEFAAHKVVSEAQAVRGYAFMRLRTASLRAAAKKSKIKNGEANDYVWHAEQTSIMMQPSTTGASVL